MNSAFFFMVCVLLCAVGVLLWVGWQGTRRVNDHGHLVERLQADVRSMGESQRGMAAQLARVEASQLQEGEAAGRQYRTDVARLKQLNEQQRKEAQDKDREHEHDKKQWYAETSKLRNQLDSARNQLKRMIPAGDWLSRDLLVDACNDLGWDAVVLTNVIVDPGRGWTQKGGYRNQVDHAVVTNMGVVVVENKNWSGLITTLRRMRNAKAPVAEFCADIVDADPDKIVHIRREESGDGRKAQVSFRVADPDPATQVVRHSIAVNKTCAHAGCDVGYVPALVLFSHKKARVDLGQCPSDNCRYAAGGGELKEVLGQTMSTSRNGVDVRAVVASLAQHRPNVVGTGCYADLTSQDESVPEISWNS